MADSGNQILLLVGGKRAKRAASEEHPFGYGRERSIYGQRCPGWRFAKLIEAAEERVRVAVPIARVIYFEPDIHRSKLRTGQAAVGGKGS